MGYQQIVDMSDDEIKSVNGGLPVVPLIALGVAVVALFGTGTALGFMAGNTINQRNESVKQK